MVSGVSNFDKWNNNFQEIRFPEIEILVKMGKDPNPKVSEDVEEGEISDAASVEEISEEDFKNQDPNLVKRKKDARVWAVRDLYAKYPNFCRGYASGLYNLAWAQAVQNKPLNDIFVMDLDSSNSNCSSSCSSSSVNAKEKSNVKEKEVVVDDNGVMLTDEDGGIEVVDVEKEDGELEEGEIDMDAEKNDVLNVVDEGLDSDSQAKEVSVREVIENVTIVNAEKSFGETCSQLQHALESLMELNCVSVKKDELIQMSLHAIKVVNSVFLSLSDSLREKNKDILLRLLSFVKNQEPVIFSVEHMEEIQSMVTSLDSIDCNSSLTSGENSKEKELSSDEVGDKEVSALCSSGECISSSKPLDPVGPEAAVNSSAIEVPEVLKSSQTNVKGRGVLLPLLDLHKDHDVDSLPSPTREAPTCFSVDKTFSINEELVKSCLLSNNIAQGSEDSKLRHYETDALKAVSTYQQKFGRSSFFMNDDLPSPTPSDNGDVGIVDTNEEVSSASRVGSLGTVKPSLLDQPASSTSVDRSSIHGLTTSKNDAITGYVSNPVKLSAKNRDPRLRFINSDASVLDLNRHPVTNNSTKVETVISKKQKAIEAPCLDVVVKRQKYGLEKPGNDTKEVTTASGVGGWLEETPAAGSQLINTSQLLENGETESKMITGAVTSPCPVSGTFNVTSSSGNEPAPISNATTSLPALLKGFAVNPSILLNILVGQQRLAEATQKSNEAATSPHTSSTCSMIGADSTVAVGPSKTTGLLQNSSGILASSQFTNLDDSARIHMKPRDPRRILHVNTLQKSGSVGSEQLKTVVAPASSMQSIGNNGNAPRPEDGLVDSKLAPSQTISPPDIARQFTRNLKNIAGIMSVSQTPSSYSATSQSFSSASGSLESDRGEQKPVVSNSENQHTGPGSAAEVDVAGSSQPPCTWGDVEHLFVGYDEQQKAAIQRERARRIEEQKKMFAARKLCLVLDLDHTLLNSAKFVEVDPVHDEILRKKEEQDREKPQRHLFRFPHMGMWTKLRPGIWNFLEKASKLFELHLYTMGNKLYATQMAKVLDPKGVLFAGRVLSRGDDADLIDGDERVPKIKDLEGVLGMESAVVIIDDSVKVWPHNKLNLIVVERYTYFPCSRRQFGLPGPSLLEIDHDERPEAGTLASSLAVIERVHQHFFASQSLEEADVRNILASEQRRILAGCRIVFSRVFPVGEANPHLHPLWQTAEQFGAVCTNQIDDQVTHVVANSLGTDKVNWALSTGRFVVHPGWVEASALLYRRANEQDFSIKP